MRLGTFFASFLVTTAWSSTTTAPAISNSPNSPYRQLSVLLEDMTHMKEKLESVESQVSQALGHNSKTAGFADEVEKQKLVLGQLNAKQKELQEQMGTSVHENEILKAQIVSLQRQLSDSQSKYQATQNTLKQMEFAWEEAKKDLRTLTEVQTKQASHMEVLERTGAAAKVVQQHNEQIQALQAAVKVVQQHNEQIQALQGALKQQGEECGTLKSAIAKSSDQISSIASLKQRIDEIGEGFGKLKEQNADKTLLLGKISEEYEGLRHRVEQIAPTTTLVQQQHEKIKELTERQEEIQGELLQQASDYIQLKESLEKNSDALAIDLHQQISEIKGRVNDELSAHNLDKTTLLGQIQSLQDTLKRQVEEYGMLKTTVAENANQMSDVTGLKQRIDEIGEGLNKLKEQNVDKTLLLGKISEEYEGLRHRFEQMAPTTTLVQQQHEKIKELYEGQQDLQSKLLQQSNSYMLLKESLEKSSNALALDLRQQVSDIKGLVNELNDHNLDKTAILEQISEESQARKMMFEQLTMANDALRAQVQSGTGSKQPADWLQLKRKLDELSEESKGFKTAQAALEQHYQLFFDEVNRQLKSIDDVLSKNSGDSGAGNAQLNQLQEQFNSLKKDLGDKWKDLSDRCKNMCASTLTQANDRLQNLAQQMQTNFDHLRERSFTKHIILSGESLTSIAKQYQTTPTKILSVNNLPNAKNLRVGDVLWIPQGM